MGQLPFGRSSISLLLVLGYCATALAQQSQAHQGSSPAPPGLVVNASPQELAAKSAAARQSGEIPEQSAMQQLTATCKLNDPPAKQTVIKASPSPCPQSPDVRGKTDADVAFDAIMDDMVERGTGVPTDAASAYQKAGTELGAAALDSAAEKLNSAFLKRAAEFIGSEAFGASLSTTLATSEAGGPADAMTLEEWQRQRQIQFQQMQSDFFQQHPQTFCVLFPDDTRCGGQVNDTDWKQLCNNLRTAWSQLQSQLNGVQSGQMAGALQWCSQHYNGPIGRSYGAQTGPAFQSAPRHSPQQMQQKPDKADKDCPPGAKVCP